MKTFEKIQPKRHADWLEERKKGIGSSEAASVLGVNPFQTAYQLWRLKKGIDAPIEENFAMKAGHYLEEAVSRFFSDETGNYVSHASACDFILRNRQREYLQVSPDRIYYKEKYRHRFADRRILECKTTQKQIDPNDLPLHWFVQLQYQLGVAECEEGALAWLTQGREFGYKIVRFNPDVYRMITKAIEDFWERYIVGNAEPPLTTYSDIARKFPTSVDRDIVATSGIIDNLATLKRVREQLKELEAAETEAEEAIKTFMEDNERLILPNGEIAATWKSPKLSTTFDYKRFESENPEAVKPYIVEKQGARRFVIK